MAIQNYHAVNINGKFRWRMWTILIFRFSSECLTNKTLLSLFLCQLMEESEDNRKQGMVGMKRIWLNYKPPFLSSLSIFQLGSDGPDMIPCHKQKAKNKKVRGLSKRRKWECGSWSWQRLKENSTVSWAFALFFTISIHLISTVNVLTCTQMISVRFCHSSENQL